MGYSRLCEFYTLRFIFLGLFYFYLLISYFHSLIIMFGYWKLNEQLKIKVNSFFHDYRLHPYTYTLYCFSMINFSISSTALIKLIHSFTSCYPITIIFWSSSIISFKAIVFITHSNNKKLYRNQTNSTTCKDCFYSTQDILQIFRPSSSKHS